MIPVTLADEPKWFDAHVRKRGAVAIQRLLGKNVKAPGRKPSVTYARPEAIPADKFPAYWTEARKRELGLSEDATIKPRRVGPG